MPVVISLYNALTGLAVGFEGFVLDNAAMIIAGTVVGAAGTLLTQLMAKAMNRSLGNVLFSNFGETSVAGSGGVTGTQKAIEASDAGVMMAYAQKIIIVPGYGLAVAQAQHKVWELAQLLMDHGVKVRFAIHPVAGRMPGHMNVLLAEAGVPYDLISDLDGRQRCGESRCAQQQEQPDIRDADLECRQGEECHRDQARPRPGLLRYRQCAVRARSNPNAVWRRAGSRESADPSRQGGRVISKRSLGSQRAGPAAP